MAQTKNNTGAKMYVPVIAVKPGQSGTEFLAKNNLATKGHIDKQPAGINFMNIIGVSNNTAVSLLNMVPTVLPFPMPSV